MAEATFTDEEWIRIQAVLGSTARAASLVTTPNPLAGIGYCGCGKALALHRRKSSSGKVHTYVRCGKSGGDGACRGAKTLAEVEAMLEEEFLDAYGDEEMKRQKFVPGEDHSRELEQTEQSVERLRWESDNGR